MSTWYHVQGKQFVILGLARSGLAAAKWLVANEAKVVGWDDTEDKRKLDDIQTQEPQHIDWKHIDALIQSPGIPFTHPITKAAIAHKVPVISDIDLLRQSAPNARFIGITGTNGKSTTTTLIAHILSFCGVDAHLGGNIGVPVMSLPTLDENGVYVLELSSYQLDLSNNLDLDISAWLNITEDHLDRHETIANYIQAKGKIFQGENPERLAIIGIDDPFSEQVYKELVIAGDIKNIIQVSVAKKATIYVENDVLFDNRFDQPSAMLNLRDAPTLQGKHNHQNAAVAYAVAAHLGLSSEEICRAIQSFPGLKHRQETIAVLDQIYFINDSKATNADAASKAIETYASLGDIYWIAGGQAKQDGIDGIPEQLQKITHAFLIGDAQERFAKSLVGQTSFTYSGTLATAVKQAYLMAKTNRKKATILFSPACASFDQFRDFEERGEAFRTIVRELQINSL